MPKQLDLFLPSEGRSKTETGTAAGSSSPAPKRLPPRPDEGDSEPFPRQVTSLRLKQVRKGESQRWLVFDADTEAQVAAIYIPGPEVAHWYSNVGAGRAEDLDDAIFKIKQALGMETEDHE